ncbi:glycosyltransferase family 2 protein [Chloroflexota bacterium]
MDNRVSQRNGVEEMKVITNNPLVSIITPVLNGINYLEICIQSVLNQSYPYIEHVFVDGGSTDGTLKMLVSYEAKYRDRIRFISEPDKSAGEAWNKGLTMAKGGILGWLGSDDVYESDTIMTVIEFFEANLDACFVFGDCNYINEKGKTIGKARTEDFNLDEAINNACYIPCPSAFYKREVIEKVGFLDTRETGVELDYWIRVGKVFQIHRIEKTLSNFRFHKDSTSGSKKADKMYAREGFIISRRHGGRIISGYGVRYFGAQVIELLRPVLGHLYPFIYHRLVYPFVKWVGRIIPI